MQLILPSIPNALENGERFPQPNWSAIAEWVDTHVRNCSLNQVWTELAREWLEMLRVSLGDDYTIAESAEFLLVAKDDVRLSNRILESCEHTRLTILKALPVVARDDGFGKHVVLAFADTNSYYDYISDFYPDEGEFALSGGLFLDRGYGHFAFCMAYGDDHERTIAHELNHNLLRHLPLPLWLNEGVTQVMEDTAVGSSYFIVDHEIVRRHRAYWNSETIDAFWSGDSFFSPDDGQELSYHLSQVLFRNLVSDFSKQIPQFLNTADYADAGNGALQQLCGVSLGDRVKQFLGHGSWEPGRTYSDVD
ncbi:hypothetical protein Q31b_47890 [Novipirellula aureliae]|uniref:DUF1570 domain-containing protein n=1 Tax=Novipirellula aureliae TaxID=2527966 RepID=A0A5C6DIH7_9BACT|nr:hypothetical protein [Novipirellula aureliae]TWU36508.1 hypothetical protein Q31b_47890 [Novipirellula aureliae]